MPRIYERPPLVETLCEFHFELSQAWDLTIPGLLYADLRSQFPKRQQTRDVIEGDVNPATGTLAQQPTVTRAVFSSEDEKLFVQVGPSILIVNQLRPYSGWEDFRSLLEHILRVYLDIASPIKLTHNVLRYINRIEIPQGPITIDDYLLASPTVPMLEARSWSAWSQRVEVPHQELNGLLTLQSGSVPGEKEREGKNDFLLDLYFSMPLQSQELASVLGQLTNAHNVIEQMFEACMTPKAREIFVEREPV